MEATVLCLQRKTHYDTKHYATFMPNTSDSMQNVHFNGRNFKSWCLFLSTNGLEVLKSNNLKPLAQPSERESCELLMAAFVNIKIEKNYSDINLYFWTSYLYLFYSFFLLLPFLPPNLNAFCRVKNNPRSYICQSDKFAVIPGNNFIA